MTIVLKDVGQDDVKQFKCDMQKAFQEAFERKYGAAKEPVLPEKDIDHALKSKGAVAYKAVTEGSLVGGAIVLIDDQTQHHHLDLLYVRHDRQGEGIGAEIWFEIEKRYPKAKVWETCTPYFDKRNIHFYLNVCGFQIVEFFNEHHIMPDAPEGFIGDGGEGMFVFRKQMKSEHLQ